jgi:hypothetical protein
MTVSAFAACRTVCVPVCKPEIKCKRILGVRICYPTGRIVCTQVCNTLCTR